nr:immunoglobulin light chain junction region [Macaca mulatta]MOW15482.1 immunoglobulin light chain junction region [Macaca mulatta]MOW16001.1 immunoglobulin light chain junction region [Macaca mulatta]MOW16063.1 immunoglobulin light chain junction region [Macaca mulatta]MOW16086.1 immunoglobulin light chain junction region [Macaca mulatta]
DYYCQLWDSSSEYFF